MKILDFAIDVEQAEHDLYQRLAACSENLSVQSIFRMVATDERKLLKKLRRMKEEAEHRQLEISVVPKEQMTIRQTQAGSCELLDQFEVRDDLSSYGYILRTEQLLLNLYSNMRQCEEDSEARNLLDMIIAEKQEEIDRIHMLFDFVNSSDRFFAPLPRGSRPGSPFSDRNH